MVQTQHPLPFFSKRSGKLLACLPNRLTLAACGDAAFQGFPDGNDGTFRKGLCFTRLPKDD